MAKPRIFISSTYSDLHESRKQVADFITQFGYEPVVFERDDIPFQIDTLIEESCYEEIKECSLFILLIKTKFGSISKLNSTTEHTSSVTQSEYNTARNLGIPIFVFIHNDSISEFRTYEKQGMRNDFKFNYLENVNHAQFVEDIYKDKGFRYINSFSDIEDIKRTLIKQWAGLFNRYLKDAQKYSTRKNESVYVNSFKLFYFRRNSGLSQAQLAIKSGIQESKIQKIEDAGVKKSHIEVNDFETLTLEELQKLADVLQCSVGNLKAGLPDDFISQYLLYYFKNKGTSQRVKTSNEGKSIFKTKAVVFDFDGTLTKPLDNLTTWEKIWIKLGYDINDCATLHRQFSISEITHKQWCEQTERKFIERNLSKSQLDIIAKDLILIDGVEEVCKELSDYGINLYICSGSIDYVIKRCLGNIYNYFDEIKSNKFHFDSNQKLKSIIGTRYDFEGKANYLSQIVADNQINPYEVFFIGNSLNDEWAHQSGAMTMCVNPTMTNPDHPFQWTYSIKNMSNLKEILPFLNYK